MPASWGAAEVLESAAETVREFRLAVSPNGSAVAVWMQTSPTDTTTTNIHARIYSPASGWGLPTVFAGLAGETATRPEIAINATGNAMLVWEQRRPGGTPLSYNLAAVRFSVATGWEAAPAYLFARDDFATLNAHRVSLDDLGNAMLVFSQDVSTGAAWAMRYVAGSGWQPSVRLGTDNDEFASNIEVALSNNGNAAVAVWSQNDANKSRIWSSNYTAGAGWTTARIIDGNSAVGYAEFPRVGVATNGDAIAVWDGSTGGSRTDIYANRLAGGVWGASAVLLGGSALSRGSTTPMNRGVCSDRSGNAMVVMDIVGRSDLQGHPLHRGHGLGHSGEADARRPDHRARRGDPGLQHPG